MLTMRRHHGMEVSAFIEHNPDWSLSQYDFQNEGLGTVLVLSKDGTVLPLSIQRALLTIQKECVLKNKVPYTNVNRGDCRAVAHVVASYINNGPLPQQENCYARKVVTYLDADHTDFFRELGYSEHCANIIEGGKYDQKFYAFTDVTAHYSMDVEQGTMDVFVVISKDKENTLGALNAIMKTNWLPAMM